MEKKLFSSELSLKSDNVKEVYHKSPKGKLSRPRLEEEKRCEGQQDFFRAVLATEHLFSIIVIPVLPLYLCKSICLFDPSSFFCFDTLLLTESADELESAALFLPRPAPLVGVPLSGVPEAAAADLGGRPRRLAGGVSISAFGVAF